MGKLLQFPLQCYCMVCGFKDHEYHREVTSNEGKEVICINCLVWLQVQARYLGYQVGPANPTQDTIVPPVPPVTTGTKVSVLHKIIHYILTYMLF